MHQSLRESRGDAGVKLGVKSYSVCTKICVRCKVGSNPHLLWCRSKCGVVMTLMKLKIKISEMLKQCLLKWAYK